MKDKEKISDINIALLNNKKSERTTFKLTANATESLKWLQKHFNLTVKEIFEYISSEILNKETDIKDIIKKTKETPSPDASRYWPRRTYVISRATLKTLNDLSKKHEISRDDLISSLIEKIKVKAMTRNESDRKKYNEAHKILLEFNNHAHDIWSRLGKVLGDDDIILSNVDGFFDTVFEENMNQIFEELEKLKKEKWSLTKKLNSICEQILREQFKNLVGGSYEYKLYTRY